MNILFQSLGSCVDKGISCNQLTILNLVTKPATEQKELSFIINITLFLLIEIKPDQNVGSLLTRLPQCRLFNILQFYPAFCSFLALLYPLYVSNSLS